MLWRGALFLLLVASFSPGLRATTRPNLVVIMADDPNGLSKLQSLLLGYTVLLYSVQYTTKHRLFPESALEHYSLEGKWTVIQKQ